MRYLLAAIALLLAGYAVYAGHTTRGKIQVIEQVLEDAELVGEDEYLNAPGRPTYVARTDICTWPERRPQEMRCRRSPPAEYPDAFTCDFTEWAAVQALAEENNRRRIKTAARVRCVREYDI